MMLSLPFIAWSISYQARHILPSQRWSDLHYGFELVFLNAKPNENSPADAFALFYSVLLSQWLPIVAAFVYFMCFGMHDSALDTYIVLYYNVLRLNARSKGSVTNRSRCGQSADPFWALHSQPAASC